MCARVRHQDMDGGGWIATKNEDYGQLDSHTLQFWVFHDRRRQLGSVRSSAKRKARRHCNSLDDGGTFNNGLNNDTGQLNNSVKRNNSVLFVTGKNYSVTIDDPIVRFMLSRLSSDNFETRNND